MAAAHLTAGLSLKPQHYAQAVQCADLVHPGGQGGGDLGLQTARTALLEVGLFGIEGGGAGREVGVAVLGQNGRGQTGGGERHGGEQTLHQGAGSGRRPT